MSATTKNMTHDSSPWDFALLAKMLRDAYAAHPDDDYEPVESEPARPAEGAE